MSVKVENHKAETGIDPGSLSRSIKNTFWISIGIVLFISILNLTGLISHLSFTTRLSGSYRISMTRITAVSFLLASISLISVYFKRPLILKSIISGFSGLFLISVSILTIFTWIKVINSGNEPGITAIPVFKHFLSSSSRMALYSAFIFLLIGVILILLTSERPRISNIVHYLDLPLSVASYIIPVSYLLNVYFIHQIAGTPSALSSGLAFCAVCIAVFVLRPDTWFMRVFISTNTGGIMSRRLLPWLAILPVGIGWLRMYGEHTGLFVSDVGVLLVEITYTFCFILLVWFTARSVNLIDKKRLDADKALKKSYDELEYRIQERTSELLKLNETLDKEVKERIKAEAMVESERKRMEGLLEMMPAYMILLTPDYHVAYSNQYFRQRFGESKGKRCFEFLFNRSEPCEICDTYKTLKENKPQTWEWTGPDNHIYSIYDFPYNDSDGSPLIMEMGIDVTDLKEAQANLVTLNDELERRVKDRTSELLKANERLDILSQTSGKLLASENPQKIINSLCQRVMKFLDCQVFFNFLVDETKGKLHLNSCAGIPERTAKSIEWLEFGVAVCGCVARDGVRIIAEDIFEKPDPRTDLVRSFGIQAYACHPLLSQGKVIGTLSFGTKSRTRFSDDDISLMKSVSDQVAIALTRIRNEESLRSSEERYRSLMELSPSASFVNRKNKIVLVNSAARKLLGVERADEILGKSPYELFHSDYHELIKTRAEIILNGGTVDMVEEKIIRADGSVRDVEVVGAGIMDSGEPAIQVIMSDITERKQAEKELFDTKNYLQNLIDYANAPIIVWDQENKIRLFNHAFERLTGYSSADVEGKKLEILFPDETLADSLLKIKQALKENWETIEIPILTIKRDIRIVLWNSARIYDENRKTISTIAQGNDITERVKAERAFKESREKLELALENGKIGTWEWEIETGRVIWDERMEKMFGKEPGRFEYNYDVFEEIVYEDDLQHLRHAISQSLDLGRPFDTVYRIKSGNGDINYISAKALLEKDNKGKPFKMSGVCFDITEMKKGAEKVLFELNENLLRSNRELEQFAYVASHDLQEPLRMVSSFTQLLQQRYKDKLDNDAQEFIQYAVDGAIRMQILINDLLDYSRIGTRGKSFSVVDMHSVLGQVIVNLNLKITEKHALITSDDLPEIFADEGQMIQLMQNLIMNSLKFCDGSPIVHVSSREENEHYLFSVKDNGIGMDPQYFNKIFQIFQRLHPREEYGGTGIGLAICKRITERHGGKIWVESEPGNGSVFYFTITKRK